MSHRFSSFRVHCFSNTNCVPKRTAGSADGNCCEILFDLTQESAIEHSFLRDNPKKCGCWAKNGVVDMIPRVVDIGMRSDRSSSSLRTQDAAFASTVVGKTTLSYTSSAESWLSIAASSTVPVGVWQAAKLQLPSWFNEKQSIECRSWAIKT